MNCLVENEYISGVPFSLSAYFLPKWIPFPWKQISKWTVPFHGHSMCVFQIATCLCLQLKSGYISGLSLSAFIFPNELPQWKQIYNICVDFPFPLIYSQMNCLIENKYISGLSLSAYIFPNELPQWKQIYNKWTFPFRLYYSHVFVPQWRAIWSIFSCHFPFSSPYIFPNVPCLPPRSMSKTHWSIFAVLSTGILCVYIHHWIAYVFVLCRVFWSPLFSCPLSFSRPFLLQCSFPFLFFYVFLAHWSIFAVVSTGILCVSFTTIATCLCPAE